MFNFLKLKYWLVDDYDDLVIRKSRFNPCNFLSGLQLIDGPFYTQEDTARALAFWKKQEITFQDKLDNMLRK